MGPLYLVVFSMGIINTDNIAFFRLIGLAVLGITFFVFLFWTVNIFLSYFISKNTFPSHAKKTTRYLWSYIICFTLFITIRTVVREFIVNPIISKEILEWKIKEFGLHSGSGGILPYTQGVFPYLIIIFMVFSINTVVLIIHGLILLLERKTIIESENTQLKIKNIEATNQKLKQQLHPHFLFNSLNVLKTLIRKQPDHAEAYLKRLSDFLRASISYDNANTVKFEDELKLSLDYLEMQKIRFGNAIQFEINIPEESKTGLLPIFSIQLLLENAIKHNAFTIESPLFIKVNCHNGWISVSNTVQPKKSDENSPGMGLSNLSERYKIISGDEIIVQNNGSDFSVSIKILTDENSDH